MQTQELHKSDHNTCIMPFSKCMLMDFYVFIVFVCAYVGLCLYLEVVLLKLPHFPSGLLLDGVISVKASPE